MTRVNVPLYKDLPVEVNAPPGSAWGVFDKDGQRDVYGTLNFITPEAVVAAKAEIRTGQSVVLNLPLQLPYHPDRIDRCVFNHEFITDAFGMKACDDEIKLNTQSTSQWDGLLHYAHQSRGEYYNGVKYEQAAKSRSHQTLGIHCKPPSVGISPFEAPFTHRIGLGYAAWSDRGGIVARGVLVDYVRYAEKKQISYDPLGPHAISLREIQDIITEEHLDIRQGDVLIVRCGLSKYVRQAGPEDRSPFDSNVHVGVDPHPELLEWLWNQNVAAVAGDAVSFEAVPASDGSFMRLHEACLPGWGMPIGELLDLEELARISEENQRWSFFLTVCPLRIEGGASTLANTLAVF